MQTFLPIYQLRSLASEDCRSLLATHAFGANNCSEQSSLEVIGKEIAKKCDGLPLAAVALGGLLHTNLSYNYWNKVLRSNIWDLPNVKVLPALLLSYHYLPAPLKRCCAYLSIFPKNSKLEKEIVVRLWIAEGLVCQSKSGKTTEKVGMRQLRVLSLSHYVNFTELPDCLGSLIYLRYLDLSNTRIRRLPDITCKLYNMQTFLLSDCWSLTKLPEDIGNLVNPRHLDISGTKLKKMPAQIATLQNLQTLSTFVISKLQDGLKVGELKNFPHLRGKLSILKLQNVIDPSEAVQANLKKKEQIDDLALEWDCGTTEDTQIERLVLKQLQPPINLKKLTIKFYGGSSFPNWLGDSSFGNMVHLCVAVIIVGHCLPLDD
ncbi:putative disease resistance protein RGA3 [Spatholobus suberectus]|nr:putative disease resistance protein RGA3 [Spatholobus suberectus]